MSYFNTTNAKGEELKGYQNKADTQDDKILSFFKSNPLDNFTPEEVWRKIFNGETPLTSVRRAITNLKNAGDLEKTKIKREGGFGRPCYCYCLKI